MSERKEYDPDADAIGSYYAAVEGKRLRGDRHWPAPKEPDPQIAQEMAELKEALEREIQKGDANG